MNKIRFAKSENEKYLTIAVNGEIFVLEIERLQVYLMSKKKELLTLPDMREDLQEG